MWMNHCEITEARERCRAVIVYHDAAQYLGRFRDLIDSISDGWAHWGYGTKCADDLMQLVNDGQWPARRLPTTEAASKFKLAKMKIRRFLSTCSQTKDKTEVRAFLEADK